MDILGKSGRGLLGSRVKGLARSRKVRFGVERLEERALLTTINEIAIPTANAAPEAMTLGLNGNLYFAENNAGQLGVLNLATQAITEVKIPTPNADPFGMATGPGGVIYFTEPKLSAIGTYNPATGAFGQVLTPTEGAEPESITMGPDGNMYFTELSGDKIGVYNTTTNTISEIGGLSALAQPYGIVSLGGNIYFTEEHQNAIGEYNLTTHTVTETPVLTANAEPLQMTVGPDGKVWFTEMNVDQIGRFDPATGSVTEYSVGSGNGTVGPSGIVTGPDGLIYFTGFVNGTIGSFDPATQAVATLSIPTSSSLPYSLVTAPDGNMYFTELAGNKIGRIVLTQNLVVTGEPRATVAAGAPFGMMVSDEFANGVVDTGFAGMVTISLASTGSPLGQGDLGGKLQVGASGGVAVFTGLTLQTAVANNVIQASSPGFASVDASNVSVIPGAAAKLVVAASPAGGTYLTNQALGAAALVEDAYGNLVTNYSGQVDLGIASNPSGGSITGNTVVTVSGGVAAFPGISFATPGTGYTLIFQANGLAAAVTGAFNIVAPLPPPPVIIGQQVIFNRRFNKKHKPIGPILSTSFAFTFDQAMNTASVTAPGNYQVDAIQFVRIKRRPVEILDPLPFTLSYMDTTNTVVITIKGRPPLPKGGQIVLLATPNAGIESAAGVFLDGNDNGSAGSSAVYAVSPHENGLTHE